MIPSALYEQLAQGIQDFLEYSFWSSTPGMERVIRDFLARPGAVTKGPFLTVELPFEQGGPPDFFPAVPLPYVPYRHQVEAFERLGGRRKRSTLVATGTGSGKTECFLLPILDACYEDRQRPGVKAVIVYPMNALAQDQAGRLARMIWDNERLRGRIRVGLYVGEGDPGTSRGRGRRGAWRRGVPEMGPDQVITDRQTLQESPPDILLTNYKMLDYLLVRPTDQGLWRHNHRGVLRFLVVDELHQFDGAKATDLACLVRRLKRRLQADDGSLCCVGTSATMGAETSEEELRAFAEQVFGEPFDEGSVIGERRQSVEEFLAGSEVRFTDEPGPEALDRLAAPRVQDPAAWLAEQERLWFPGEALDRREVGSPDWAVELGERLRAHSTFRSLLRVLAGDGGRAQARRPVALDDLLDGLARTRASWRRDPEFGRAAVLSLLGLASAARRRVALPDGRQSPPQPFLGVRVHLWQRELRRMVASVTLPGTEQGSDGSRQKEDRRPRLAFSDDLDRKARRRHLPLVHCRECGAMGWATRQDPKRKGVWRTDLRRLYQGFFGGDPDVRFLFPEAAAPPGDEQWARRPRVRLDTLNLEEVPEGREVPPGAEVVRLVVVEQTEKTGGGGRRLVRDCPFCGARDSLALVGFRAATLTSVYVDQFFASRFAGPGDRKLLVFSDSVQDAAHRAGFLASRTWRTNLRIALAKVLQEAGEPVRLPELASRLADYWAGRMDPETWAATFLAPDMAWLNDWEELQEKGALPRGSDLPQLVRRRLDYEVHLEFGHQAQVGRSLPRTGVAAPFLDPERLEAAAERAEAAVRRDWPRLRGLDRGRLLRFLLGFLHRLRLRGAVFGRELPERYIRSLGEDIYVFKARPHLPAYGKTSRLPAFLVSPGPTGRFDSWTGRSWYARWVERSLFEDETLYPEAREVYPLILSVLREEGICEAQEGGPRRGRTAGRRAGRLVWGLLPEVLLVETRTVRLRCSGCGHELVVGASEARLWEECDVPCARVECRGRYRVSAREDGPAQDYFGRLYLDGDLQRIYAAEHTGLLTREERERLERRFKATGDGDRKPWYPNLLSCTPTLEMGIDVGDLEAVVLASVPPTKANYLQRVGRAGRRDGNSFVLAVANARPHDLYVFARPEEMLAAAVPAPGLYLDAEAVLERQLAAFCFDSWVAEAREAARLPATLGEVFPALEANSPERFPHNFVRFVQERAETIWRGFREMLSGARVSEETFEVLQTALFGQGEGPGGAQAVEADQKIAWRLLALLHEEKKARDDLKRRTRKLAREVRKLKTTPARPKDLEERVRDLEQEREALGALVKEIEGRNLLEFLTDEGFLPNYAFPEAAVRLRSVIWRRWKPAKQGVDRLKTWVKEYVRSPATALSEFAPNAEFYADGRRVRIDQVDLSVSEVETWRFCDRCHHAERVDREDRNPVCPACGSSGWADEDQKRKMVRLRQVVAVSSDRESRIRDDRDERTPRYYKRHMLVDVRDEARRGAWVLEADETIFGFEYFDRLAFRDVNFGDLFGEAVASKVAGKEEKRPGFRICLRCGKVQAGSGERHTRWCPTVTGGRAPQFEDCLYLYREFESEALRMLLPVLDQEGVHSFLAAFRLGLRDLYGGRVDHLQVTDYSEPESGTPLRKRYAVLYDTVPGGTGYVAQLVRRSPAGGLPILEVLERARKRIQGCSCWTDPERDGCYECVLGYRNAQDMPDVSTRRADEILGRILKARDGLREIRSLARASVRGMLDSELEARFLEALRRAKWRGRPLLLRGAVISGRPAYFLRVGGRTWAVEPQVQENSLPGGVSIDFVFRPLEDPGARPLAVFLDGWRYHERRLGRDLLQRMFLQASGRWDVWSLTWWDLDEVMLEDRGNPYRNFPHPDPGRMVALGLPSSCWGAVEAPMFELLVSELAEPREDERRRIWTNAAKVYLASRMAPAGPDGGKGWEDVVGQVVPEYLRDIFQVGAVKLACLEPLDGELLTVQAVYDGRGVRALVVYDDARIEADEEARRRAWHGMLRLFWFLREAWSEPPESMDVWFLARAGSREEDLRPLRDLRWHRPAAPWDLEDVTPAFLPLCEALAAAGLPPPEVGRDLPDSRGRALAEAELVWEAEAGGLAVVDERQLGDLDLDRLAPGWTILRLEELLAEDRTPSAGAPDRVRRLLREKGVS